MQTFRYAKPKIAIHWLATALIVFLLVTGTFVLVGLPNTAQKIGNLHIRMIFGGLAGLLAFGNGIPPGSFKDFGPRRIHGLASLPA